MVKVTSGCIIGESPDGYRETRAVQVLDPIEMPESAVVSSVKWQSSETMPKTLDPFRFVLMAVAGWMNQEQQHAIQYLREENRVLRAQLGNRRLRLTDDQRRVWPPKPV